MYWLLVLVAVGAGLWSRLPRDAKGDIRAIDGDSLVVGGVEMRLKGIDAPEGPQDCERGGQRWRCGDAARDHLLKLAKGGALRCSDHGADQHGRRLSTCYAGGANVNEAMVRDGFAVAYGAYEAAEAEAKAAKRGLWAGNFERPRAWRGKHMR